MGVKWWSSYRHCFLRSCCCSVPEELVLAKRRLPLDWRRISALLRFAEEDLVLEEDGHNVVGWTAEDDDGRMLGDHFTLAQLRTPHSLTPSSHRSVKLKCAD